MLIKRTFNAQQIFKNGNLWNSFRKLSLQEGNLLI